MCATSSYLLSVNGRLGCVHVLATVISAAVTVGAHHLPELQFCLDIYPEIGSLNHMVVLFLVF